MTPLHIGILGCATVAEYGMAAPARDGAPVRIVAVGSRSLEKAEAFAQRHGIPAAYGSYEAVLADPAVQAIYVPLPNGLHAHWAMAALRAGHHVLCEKPGAANAAEAERMAQAAREADRLLAEARHWTCHPLAHRLRELLDHGELGQIRHFEAALRVQRGLVRPDDVRLQADLAGGALLDEGFYPVSLAQFVMGQEPEHIAVSNLTTQGGVDTGMDIDLRYANGTTAHLRCAMMADDVQGLEQYIRIDGSAAQVHIDMPFTPAFGARFMLTRNGQATTEPVDPRSSWYFQVCDFAARVAAGERGADPLLVTHMRLLDRIAAVARQG